ncbi:c-type cytochrome [Niveispirillum fermenti]|uniref:c-type cytochrome n=1 Tax=Niveispirillum fermenti TaxID=1233113 RepID=UPI003A8A37C2
MVDAIVRKETFRVAVRAAIHLALALVTAGLVPVAAAQTGPDKGERLFLRCRTCHEVAEGRPNKVGPNLHGFFDKPAAQVSGFKYSQALRDSGVVWDDEAMHVWLTHPTDLVPGTTMAFIGLPDKADRDALIAYLRKATN